MGGFTIISVQKTGEIRRIEAETSTARARKSKTREDKLVPVSHLKLLLMHSVRYSLCGPGGKG